MRRRHPIDPASLPHVALMLPLFVLLGVSAKPLFSQSAAGASWSGQAQCQVTVQGPGYSHQETHTWTLSGGPPTQSGAMRIYAATWSVTGGGSLTRTQGTQTLQAQWTTNATLPNAPIAMFVRASDGRLIIKSWHAQLRSPGGVTGTQQVTINGVPQSPGTISLEAFEWQFPLLQDAQTSTSVSGSSTTATNGAVGPMQLGGSQGTAACSWQFSQGGSSLPQNGSNGQQNPGSQTQPGNNPNGAQSNSGGSTTGSSGNSTPTNSSGSGTPGSPATSTPTGSSNSQGQSGSGTPSTGTTATPAPTNVTATAGDASALVSWVAPAGPIASYIVQTLPAGTTTTTSATQLTISGLMNGSTYTFQVIAINNQGLTSSPVVSNPVTPMSSSVQTPGNTGNGPVVARQPGVTAQTSASGTGQKLAATLPASLSSVRPGNSPPVASLAVTLTGSYTHFADGKTIATFVPTQAQPGANSGCVNAALNKAADSYAQILSATNISALGSSPTNSNSPSNSSSSSNNSNSCPPAPVHASVKVSSPTSATATVNIDPSAPPGAYNVTVTTSLASGQEVVSLSNAFYVVPGPNSATYRVTMTGLMCMRHITGGGDAIYGAAVIRQYDRRNGQGTMSTNANTWVYGDTNGVIGQRVQAGSRGPLGGIQAGDFVPTGFIVGPKDTLPPQSNIFPMVLFQGTLTDGIDALVISPSLWISYGDNSMFFNWNQNEDSLTNSIYLESHVQNQINTQTFGALSFGASENVSGSASQVQAGDATQIASILGAGFTFGIPVGTLYRRPNP